MTIWLDAHLPPQLCSWIASTFDVDAVSVRDLGLRDAEDRETYQRAGSDKAVVMSKDRDFVDLSLQLGAPPHIIWLRCGNTSNKALREILAATLGDALDLISHGVSVVEITGTSD